MLPIKRQGNHVVLRDDKGKVRAHALMSRAATPETWRRGLHKLTDGGRDMQLTLIDLMHGNVYQPRLPDGRLSSEIIIPTPEVRRAAAMNLHEMLHGKAVAETEVLASDREAEKKVQLESMTNEQLQAYVDADYKELLPESTEPHAAQKEPDAE